MSRRSIILTPGLFRKGGSGVELMGSPKVPEGNKATFLLGPVAGTREAETMALRPRWSLSAGFSGWILRWVGEVVFFALGYHWSWRVGWLSAAASEVHRFA